MNLDLKEMRGWMAWVPIEREYFKQREWFQERNVLVIFKDGQGEHHWRKNTKGQNGRR